MSNKRKRLVNGHFVFDKGRLVPWFLLIGSVGLSLGVDLSRRIIQVQASQGAVEIEAATKDDGQDHQAGQTQISTSTAPASKTESGLIEDAVNEFLPKYKSESLMIMHCLAHRESKHGVDDNHGDGGLAGGPFQFHQETWNRMRKQMGEVIGDRYDFKESSRTTAWAIANGRAKEWGPILRNSRGSNYAACQTPSWY